MTRPIAEMRRGFFPLRKMEQRELCFLSGSLIHADGWDFQPADRERMDYIGVQRISKRCAFFDERAAQLAFHLDVVALLHAAREAAEVWAGAEDGVPRSLRYPFARSLVPDAGLDRERKHRVGVRLDMVRGGNFGVLGQEASQNYVIF